jgi:GTP-binding protein
VGKSTLFNRLLGRREAIVAALPGTTRDRLFASTSWSGHPFVLVDTGGLETRPQDPLRQRVKEQVELAMLEADLVVFLLDVAEGLTPMDEEVAQQLRRLNKPIVVAVNKVDNPARELSAAEFHKLGLGDPVTLSAYHNTGIDDLMERVTALLPREEPEEPGPEGEVRLAIVGRPNVGKSMLVNAILGQERAIVNEQPGTTRDTLDTSFRYKEQPTVLIDTAGIRRRGRVQAGVERYSVLRALRAVERCDIAVLVLDATELVAAQDAHIAGLAWEAWKGVIVAVNKWDLSGTLNLSQERAEREVVHHLHFMSYIPICFTSALQGQGIEHLMETAMDLHRERLHRADPEELHRILTDTLSSHPLPRQGRRFLRIHQATQDGVNPPTFRFTVNYPDLVHFSYRRYLENRLREGLGYRRSHLRLTFRSRREAS